MVYRESLQHRFITDYTRAVVTQRRRMVKKIPARSLTTENIWATFLFAHARPTVRFIPYTRTRALYLLHRGPEAFL